jgi:TetR/AcrR family transcriptional regulator, tetracycline repressor protein
MYMSSLPIITCTAYGCQVTSSTAQLSGDGESSRDEGERTRLTRRAVVDRAMQLADATGLDGLTIRKLAQELGVTPMALYWHFRSKDALLDGLTERVWSEIDIDVDAAAPWTDQLRGLLESLLQVLRAHPAAPALLLNQESQNEFFLRATETTLDVLRNAGFDPRYASEIARTALWTGITLVMSEAGITSLDADDRTELQRRKQVVFATLPAVRYPRLVECAAPMTACDDPEFHYQLGIDVFIAGVQAMAARVSR